jgi:hypothetical protein
MMQTTRRRRPQLARSESRKSSYVGSGFSRTY